MNCLGPILSSWYIPTLRVHLRCAAASSSVGNTSHVNLRQPTHSGQSLNSTCTSSSLKRTFMSSVSYFMSSILKLTWKLCFVSDISSPFLTKTNWSQRDRKTQYLEVVSLRGKEWCVEVPPRYCHWPVRSFWLKVCSPWPCTLPDLLVGNDDDCFYYYK